MASPYEPNGDPRYAQQGGYLSAPPPAGGQTMQYAPQMQPGYGPAYAAGPGAAPPKRSWFGTGSGTPYGMQQAPVQQGPMQAGFFAPNSQTPFNKGSANGMDVEAQAMHAFAERTVRHGFVRKVFFITAIQLAITTGFAAACLYVDPIKNFVSGPNGNFLFYLAWGLSFVIILAISCSESLRRKWPGNMILLGLFTICEAFLIGMITSFFGTAVVLIAFLVTACAVIGITIFSCQTKYDITGKGTYLFVLLITVAVLALVGGLWHNQIVHLVIAGFASLIFSAYLMYDIQMIMGGRSHSISPDEYVFASLTLYLDIINLFLCVLNIVALTTNNG